MKTIVVNRYKENYDVYVGRGTKWGNICSHKKGPGVLVVCKSRDEAIDKYKNWLLGHPELLSDLYELKNKTIACSCKPKRCHGDILAELANNLPDIDDHSEPLEVYW